MIKRRRFKRQKRRNNDFIRNNQKTVFLIILFIIGLFTGALSVKSANAEALVKIKELAENYISLRSSESILQNFTSFAINDLIYIAISMVFGLCIIGKPILWSLPIIRGLGIGLLSGYIYNTYSIKGLMFCIIMIFIPNAISVCAMLISCKESILTVNDLQKFIKESKEVSLKDYYKMFFLRNAILYFVMLFAGALGSLIIFIPNQNISLLF